MTDTATAEPCCADPEPHYHCVNCNEMVGMMGHLVGGRIICDRQERRAYLRNPAAQNTES